MPKSTNNSLKILKSIENTEKVAKIHRLPKYRQVTVTQLIVYLTEYSEVLIRYRPVRVTVGLHALFDMGPE
jgi:hypothetical protein